MGVRMQGISKGNCCSNHCLRIVWEQRPYLFTCIALVPAHNRALINICWMHTEGNVWIIGLISYCSVAQVCPALCDHMDCSMPCCPVPHQLLELTQTHVHQLKMPSNHLILCCPLLFLPLIFPNIRIFSNESLLHIRQPKYWSFSFSISPSSEYSGLISLRIDGFDLLAVQGTLKSLIQHLSSKASSALSFPYGLTLTSMHPSILEKPSLWLYRPLPVK